MKFKKKLLLWNYWANLNQTLLKWSLDGPLSKLCPSAPSCIVMAAILDTGRRWRTQFLKGTTEGSSQQSFVEIGSVVSEEKIIPFYNCVRQRRPVSKMAAITKNRNFFKWPKLLYFKPESAQIWTV
jgi:hypothetical protein